MKCQKCGNEFSSEADVGIMLTDLCLVCDEIAYNKEMDALYLAEADQEWHHMGHSDISDDPDLPF